jgi:hypothetical protein
MMEESQDVTRYVHCFTLVLCVHPGLSDCRTVGHTLGTVILVKECRLPSYLSSVTCDL